MAMDPEALRMLMVQKLTNAANMTGPLGRHLLSDSDRAFLTGSASFIQSKLPAGVLQEWANYVPASYMRGEMNDIPLLITVALGDWRFKIEGKCSEPDPSQGVQQMTAPQNPRQPQGPQSPQQGAQASQPQTQTMQQARQVEGAFGAIDWSAIDWTRVGAFIKVFLQLLGVPLPANADPNACTDKESCKKFLKDACSQAA